MNIFWYRNVDVQLKKKRIKEINLFKNISITSHKRVIAEFKVNEVEIQ